MTKTATNLTFERRFAGTVQEFASGFGPSVFMESTVAFVVDDLPDDGVEIIFRLPADQTLYPLNIRYATLHVVEAGAVSSFVRDVFNR